MENRIFNSYQTSNTWEVDAQTEQPTWKPEKYEEINYQDRTLPGHAKIVVEKGNSTSLLDVDVYQLYKENQELKKKIDQIKNIIKSIDL